MLIKRNGRELSENDLRGEKSQKSDNLAWNSFRPVSKLRLFKLEPPGYRLKEPRLKPKIGAYLEQIAQIIEEDKALPKKQRHTAKRIYERIREMGYGGKCPR